MRVVVNRLAAVGQKTGIGHYTAQLLRCLHELTRFVPSRGKEEHETRASPVRCSHDATSN